MLKHTFGYLSRKIKLGFKTWQLCLEIENEILPLSMGYIYGGFYTEVL